MKRQPATTARMPTPATHSSRIDRSSGRVLRGSAASAGVRRKRFSAARPSSIATSASLIEQDDAVSGLDQRAKAFELDDGERKAGQHQHATTGTATRENRCSTGSNVAVRFRASASQRRQRADPEGDADAVQEHRRPGQPLRRRGRGVAACGQRQPDAGHRDARSAPRRIVIDALCQRQPRDQPSPRSRSAATVRGWCRARSSMAPSVARPLSGRSSTSRPCRPSEATALTRPMRNAAMISRAPLGALPDPGGEKHAADADEQAEIDADPRQPDQAGNRPA